MNVWTKRRIAKGLLISSLLYFSVFAIVWLRMSNFEKRRKKEHASCTIVPSTNETAHLNSPMGNKDVQKRNKAEDLLKTVSTAHHNPSTRSKGFRTKSEAVDFLKKFSSDNSSNQDSQTLTGLSSQINASQRTPSHPANSNLEDIVISEKEEPMPTFPHFLKHPVGECVAPLEIKSRGSNSHVIRLVDSKTCKVILDYFLPAGLTKEILVPHGSYELRFASGNKWYGTDNLFGKTTRYTKANSTFFFSTGQGYSITLYTVPYGNLHTETISEEEF